MLAGPRPTPPVLNKNPAYRRLLNLSTCADRSTLRTPPLCTVGWFATTKMYALVEQPICPVQKKVATFEPIVQIKKKLSQDLECPRAVLYLGSKTFSRWEQTDRHLGPVA